MRIRDVSHLITSGNLDGCVLQADDGSLSIADVTGSARRFARSTDGGLTWTQTGLYSDSSFTFPRLAYRAKNGYLYFGLLSVTVNGNIVRSTDNGNT